MTIRDGILKDRNSQGQIYLINLETGEKVEVIFLTQEDKKKILFIKTLEENSLFLLRDTITPNDIARASSVIDLTKFKDRKTTKVSDEFLKKISMMIKEGLLSEELKVEYYFEGKKIVI